MMRVTSPLIHLVPCSILIVLNALLVRTMRQAQRRRRQLLAQNRKSECRRLAEKNMTTMMLVAVVGVFLLAGCSSWSGCSSSPSVPPRRTAQRPAVHRHDRRQQLGTSDPQLRVVVSCAAVAESLHPVQLSHQLLHLLRDEPPVPRRVS